MPRYFFHLEHAEDVRDIAGTDLPDLAAAKCEAVQVIARELCAHPQGFWDADTYQVTVSDAGGLTLFMVAMMAVLAPVSAAVSRP